MVTYIKHTRTGVATTVYTVDELGYTLLNGEKFQGSGSMPWRDAYSFVYVTIKDGDKTSTIPILAQTINGPYRLMFDGDDEYLESYGVSSRDFEYICEYSLGSEYEADDGKTIIIDTTPPTS